MRELLNRPDFYDGKRVQFGAWVTLENENYNVWETKQAMEGFDVSKCLSLQNYQQFESGPISRFNRTFVKVSGVFSKDVTQGRPLIRWNACSDEAIALDPNYQPIRAVPGID
jgi:hypothetical protein